MRVSEIRVKQIRVNQGLGVFHCGNSIYKELVLFLRLLKLNLVGHHITCAMYFQFHIFAHDKGWAFFQALLNFHWCLAPASLVGINFSN